jgi:phosphoenolpyruvate carboxylase
MALADDLERIAQAAAAFAAPEERVSGILVAEPLDLGRVYLCAYETEEGRHSWLGLDDGGRPVASARAIREATSLAALCEVAEESAGGGHLAELAARLAELRETEAPEGIEEAIESARALAETLEEAPRLATTAYLDRIGAAARRLEQTLGDESGSPFANAMQQALTAVEELAAEVGRHYKGPLA